MIITIDGPAGSGKSSISKQVAENLQFEFLDTGAMYRALAYIVKERNIDLDSEIFPEFLEEFTVFFQNNRIIANDIDVTDVIRTPEIDVFTSSYISTNTLVRKKMCDLQRKAVHGKNVVAEGRDMGSHVFPNAELKIYLDAHVDVRAQRRFQELKAKGIHEDLTNLHNEILSRDFEDMNRQQNPLCVPENAVIIDTSELKPIQVLNIIIALYEKTTKTP